MVDTLHGVRNSTELPVNSKDERRQPPLVAGCGYLTDSVSAIELKVWVCEGRSNIGDVQLPECISVVLASGVPW